MIWFNFVNMLREKPQKSFRLIALNPVILKPKIETNIVFQSEKYVEFRGQKPILKILIFRFYLSQYLP